MLKPNIVKIITVFSLILLGVGGGAVMAQSPSDVGAMANPGTGTDQNGQTVNIQINTPLDGATVPIPPGQVSVTGQAVVGTETFNDPGAAINVLYVVDVSGSTDDHTGQDCDGNGVDGNGERNQVGGDNFNGDSTIGDTLDCEISGLLTLNNYLDTLSGINVGIVVFAGNGAVADVTPSGGDDPFTTPTADQNNNGARDIEEVARSIDGGEVNEFVSKSAGVGTDFPDALSVIPPVMANRTGTKRVFFLTDGDNRGGDVTDALQPIKDAGIPVNTYSVGSGAEPCDPGEDIRTIADETGGQCVEVEDPTKLGESILGTSPVDRVEVTLNGGSPVVASIDVFGNWNLPSPLTGIVPGANTIQATAFTDNDQTTVVADITVYGVVGTITLTPDSDTNPINSDHTITLVVEDAQGNPLANQTVDITVSGANSETTTVTTDSNGQATFTYTGASAGTDTITASTNIGGNTVTAQATKIWTQVVFTDPDPDPFSPGETCTFTTIIYDDTGNILPNQQVVYTITRPDGTLQENLTAVSDANGRVVITDACAATSGSGQIELCIDENGNATHDPGEPTNTLQFTQITLLSFTAEAGDDQVTLAWETASELDNEGFNIWRSTSPDGGFAKLNPELIAPQGDELTGASYSFVDTTVESGTTYYYQLEDIDFNGLATLHEVVTVELTAEAFEPVDGPGSITLDQAE